MQVRILPTKGHYIEAYCIDRVARSVLRVAPVSVFQYSFWSQSVHGRTRACHARRRGSLPLGTAKFIAVIAPMVEQRTENSCVAGSSPAYGTKFCKCQQEKVTL